MSHENFPFVQKRFFEEFEAWTAVEHVSVANLLTEKPRLQLEAKPIDQAEPKETAAEEKPEGTTAQIKPKPIPPPPTDAQIRDRREILREQAASLKNHR